MSRVFAGDRRVWRVAAIVGGLLLALTAVELAVVKRGWVTGTDSVSPRTKVVDVAAGDRVCMAGLEAPAGTGAVRIAVSSSVPRRPALDVELRIPGRVLRGVAPAGAAGYKDVVVALLSGTTPARPESVPATLCATPRASPGRITFWGFRGVMNGDPRLRAGTRSLGVRLAVDFLPPAGERRTYAALWDRVALHATRFRPAWVGSWTYYLLFALVAALWIPAVRVLALASAGRAPRFAAIALIAFGNIAAWTLITPSFDSPDEMEHYAYAQHLAETGKPPSRDPGPPARSTEEVAALDGVRLVSHIETADGRPPWLAADVARWHAEERRLAPLRRDNGGGPTTAATHSPLYYSLLLPGYAAGSSGTVFARLWAMRLLSALLGALTAGVVLLAVRELLPDRPALAAAAGLLVAFQPMVGFISGAVNNDAGVNLVAALLVYLVVRALRRGLGTGLGAAIGATLVVLPLMKLTGFALYPAAAIGLAGVAWRARARGALRPAPWAAAAGAFVVAAAAWAALAPGLGRSLLPTPGGAVTPGSTAPGGVSAAAHPLDFLSYLWQVFLPRLPFMGDLHVQRWPAFDIYVQRGWGAFGWYAKLFPDWVYGVIAVAMLAAGALALRLLWRARRGAARALAPELLFLASVALFVVLAVEIAYFTNVKFRSVVAEQGRYAFPAITALAGIAVAGAAGAGRRWAVPVLTAMVVGVIGLSFASQLLTLTSFYT